MGSWLQAVPEDRAFAQGIHTKKSRSRRTYFELFLRPEAEGSKQVGFGSAALPIGFQCYDLFLSDTFLINSLSNHQEACLIAGRALNL